MSLSGQLQKGLGRFLKQWYRVANRFKVDYTIITDLTDVPNNILILTGIFLKKTPALTTWEDQFGRRRTFKPRGGALSQDALPLFKVSRQSLKDTSGSFLIPTKFDTFVQQGTIEPIFYVKDVETIGEDAAGFILTVTTIFEEHALGSS